MWEEFWWHFKHLAVSGPLLFVYWAIANSCPLKAGSFIAMVLSDGLNCALRMLCCNTDMWLWALIFCRIVLIFHVHYWILPLFGSYNTGKITSGILCTCHHKNGIQIHHCFMNYNELLQSLFILLKIVTWCNSPSFFPH